MFDFVPFVGGNNMNREEILQYTSENIGNDRGGKPTVNTKTLSDGSTVLDYVSKEENGASRIGRDIILIEGDEYTKFSTYPTSYEISGNACRLNVYRGKVGEETPKPETFIMVSANGKEEVEAMINALRTSSPELAAQLMKCAGYGEITNEESKKIINDIKEKRGGEPIVIEETLNDGTIILDCNSTEKGKASLVGRDIVLINGSEYTKFSTYPTREGEQCWLEVEKGEVGKEEAITKETQKFVMTSAKGDDEIRSMIAGMKKDAPQLANKLKNAMGSPIPVAQYQKS